MKYNKLDIILLQEHNIRNLNAISQELHDFCHVIINLAIAHKGGTAILIDRRVPFNTMNVEKSANSRIISLRLSIYNKTIHILNTYAHASNRNDREELFN